MYFGQTGNKLVIVSAFIAGLAFFAHGWDKVSANFIFTLETYRDQLPKADILMRDDDYTAKYRYGIQGMYIAIQRLGSILGSFAGMTIADKLGRICTIAVGCFFAVAGTVIQCSMFDEVQYCAARVLCGVGVGMVTACVPCYLVEISRFGKRGRTLIICQLTASLLTAGGAWLSFGVAYIDSEVDWRMPVAFQGIFALCFIVSLLSLPESPRWLTTRQKSARSAVNALYNCQNNDLLIDKEVERFILQAESRDTGGIFEKKTRKKHFKRTMIALLAIVSSQLCGHLYMTFYSVTLYEVYMDFSSSLSRGLTAGAFTWASFVSLLTYYLIDRIGRRFIMIFSMGGMLLVHVALCGVASSNFDTLGCKIGAVILIYCGITFYTFGLYIVPWLYCAEICPLATRSRVCGVASALYYLLSFAFTSSTPIGIYQLGWKYHLIFTCTSLLALVLLFLYAPETKGKSLTDIDQMFIGTNMSTNAVKTKRSNIDRDPIPEFEISKA